VEAENVIKIVYTCPTCKGRFDPKDLYELVRIDEDDFDYLCPKDETPLKWGLE
jgi:hypothetical protein